MLEANSATRLSFPRTELEPDFSKLITNFFDLVGRQRTILLGSVLLALLFAAGYLFVVAPTYRSTASIVVVDPQMDPLRQAAAQRTNNALPSDSGMVDTQVEILRSDTIALSVIRSLKLRKEDQLSPPLAWAYSLFDFETSPARSEQTVLAQFRNRSNIRRVGISNVVEVSYRSNSPARAAQIANAIVAAYFDEQRNAKVQAGQAASAWLKEQISELTKQTISVDSIVGEGKPRSSMTNDTSGDRDQQVAELRKDREAARAETAQARASLEVQTDKASSAEAQSRYEAARANEAAIQAKLNTFMQGSLDASRERAVVGTVEADALRSAYNGLLQRLMSVRYEAFPGVDARIISSASEPLRRSNPQTTFALAGALAVGLVFGFSGALIRDGLDRTARGGSQLQRALHLPFLGSLPNLKAGNKGCARPERVWRTAGAQSKSWSANLSTTSHRIIQRWSICGMIESVVRLATLSKRLAAKDETSRLAADFAETLRNVRFEVGLIAPSTTERVVGFTSARDCEGKGTVAGNFASLLEESGHRVALVAADLRSPSNSDENPVEIGLWQVLTDRCPVQKAATKIGPGVLLLSAGRRLPAPAAADLLSSAKMQNTLQLLKERHDVIVIDLPPLCRLADLKAIGVWIDSLVLVVEYGRTSLDNLRSASEIEVVREKCAGVLLNRAPSNYSSA